MIDEPPRGAEGLPGEWEAQPAAAREHPSLWGAGGTPAPVFWVTGLPPVCHTTQAAQTMHLGEGRQPGTNPNEGRKA